MVKWPLVGDDVGVISDPIILRISHIFVRPCTDVITSLLGMKFEYLKSNNKHKYSSGREKKYCINYLVMRAIIRLPNRSYFIEKIHPTQF